MNAACESHEVSRRRFLCRTGLGALAASLSRMGPLTDVRGSEGGADAIRSCILLFYYGGPSQLDTWDLKPGAPSEVRGEFRPIATSVPGVQIGEHLPRCSRIMDKLAVIRSMHHPMRNHNAAAVEVLCGRTPLRGDLELLADDANSFPCFGSILSQQLPGQRAVPAHVSLPHVMYNVVVLPGQTAGFLGAAYNPFQVTHDPNDPSFRVDELELPADLPLGRLDGRQSLLTSLHSGQQRERRSGAMGIYQERAFRLLRSERVRRAFDLSRENASLRERYGRHRLGQSLLLARRLVEAGVRFINVNDKITNGQTANWDSHENNFGRLKNDLLPPADQAFSALIADLADRGLLETTLVLAVAEFGRTPRINTNVGRDHWPDCFSAVLAGGGVHGGATYGTSDRFAAYPALDPVSCGDLAATLLWRFGLNPETEVRDQTSRPYRLAEGQPLRRLFA